MRRIGTFLIGVIFGGLVVFTSLNYHVLKTDEGLYLIPKLESGFGQAYVDIRKFGVPDWTEHPALAEAIIKSDKSHLLKEAAGSAVRNTVRSALNDAAEREIR